MAAGAHTTQHAAAMHLALLASLGKFGLSEHMALEAEADLPCAATGAGRRTVKGIGTEGGRVMYSTNA